MSGFADLSRAAYISPNDLMNSTRVNTYPQELQLANQNALLSQQSTQQEIGAKDTEMVGRLAQSLVAMPEEEAAKAYGPGIAYLQQQGFAKRAPPTYPGHAVAQRLAALAVPAAEQYKQQQNRAANELAYPTPGGGTGGAPGTAATAPAGGGGAGRSTSYAGGIAGFEGGGAADPGENPLWPIARGGPAGGHGFIRSTWQAFAAANPDLFKGMTPEQVLAARTDPALSERATNWYAAENAKVLQASGIEPTPANLGISHALGPGGARKVLAAADSTPLSQVIPETIAQNPQYGRMTVGDLKQKYARLGPVGGQQVAAAPVAPAGGGGTPAPYQVATIGSTPPPPTQAAPVAPAAALPPAEAAKQAQATGQPVEIMGGNGLWALPNGTITSQPPARPAPAVPAAQQPAAPTAPRQAAAPAAPAEPMPSLDFTPQQQRVIAAEKLRGNDIAPLLEKFTTANIQRQKDWQAREDKRENDARLLRQEVATARQREVENARAGVPTGMQRNAEGVIEPIPGFRGATAEERINYALKNDPPDSQEYTDAWRAKKWQMAPNGSVIEADMSEYPPPARSVRRPTFLPQPTGTALDEVRKADTDARVIVPAIDHYVDLHKKIGGSSWGAYFDNPKDPKAQQLIGAFNAMKTVLRSPTYANTGVLQPAEMEMLKQELVSPQTIRGLYASPQALEARLHEIKFAILSRQDAELRSVGRDGVIVRSDADLASVPDGGKFYDEDGNFRVKTKAEK